PSVACGKLYNGIRTPKILVDEIRLNRIGVAISFRNPPQTKIYNFSILQDIYYEHMRHSPKISDPYRGTCLLRQNECLCRLLPGSDSQKSGRNIWNTASHRDT